MKKTIFVLTMIIVTIAFTVAFASADSSGGYQYTDHTAVSEPIFHTFSLPTSLEIIEDEAFEGTAACIIVLPDMVTKIGERTFANIPVLHSIQIPSATTSIAKTAFAGSGKVTITAAPNSYARTWAKENSFPFSSITILLAGTGGQNAIGSLTTELKEIADAMSPENQETNRNWRKLEEIHVQNTIEIFANAIQSRAPPMG